VTDIAAPPAACARASATRDRLGFIALAIIVLSFGLGFAWLSVLRHLAFQSHAFDLGNMDQAVWNTLHGAPLRFTDMVTPGEIAAHPSGAHILTNRLAIHVEPLLLLLAPLYLVHPAPSTLLVAQAAIVATGAIPAYLLARSLLGRPLVSLAFPLAYVLHPSLQNALLDDFHAVTLSAAFLLWAMYWLYADSMPGFWAATVLALATKEEIGLLVALLGVALLLRHRVQGALAIALGTAWFVVLVAVIIPHFNPGGRSPYLARYAYLGHGLRGILSGALRHPDLVWHTLTAASRVTYLDAVLEPLGFVSLLGLPVLLLVSPTLAINMLSADPTMYSGFYQYSAEVVPYVVVSAIVGTTVATRVARRLPGGRWVAPVLAALIVVASVLETRTYGFTPVAAGFVIPSVGAHQQLETRLLKSIPSGAVVAAADEIEPHLSDRRSVYLLPAIEPGNGPAAEYVALDASIPSLPTLPATLHRATQWALRHGYGVQSASDGVLILRRGAPARQLPASFYHFAFTPPGKRLAHETASWGPLQLVGVTIHPGYGWVNRSRPAAEVETYWRVARTLPAGARIELYVVRHGDTGPVASVGDSPTWDWLPLHRWPLGRTVHAALVPLPLDTYRAATVSLILRVSHAGRLRGMGPGQRVPTDPLGLRIGTIDVRP
jgi:uncharacterized membrane protein